MDPLWRYVETRGRPWHGVTWEAVRLACVVSHEFEQVPKYSKYLVLRGRNRFLGNLPSHHGLLRMLVLWRRHSCGAPRRSTAPRSADRTAPARTRVGVGWRELSVSLASFIHSFNQASALNCSAMADRTNSLARACANCQVRRYRVLTMSNLSTANDSDLAQQLTHSGMCEKRSSCWRRSYTRGSEVRVYNHNHNHNHNQPCPRAPGHFALNLLLVAGGGVITGGRRGALPPWAPRT